MTAFIRRKNKAEVQAELPAGDRALAVDSAELLLSMVESAYGGQNGTAKKMESQQKAQQELEKIESQLSRLQELPGQEPEIRHQIQQLHDRIHDLRRQVATQSLAWQKTELARHPQRPQTLDYIERLFSDFSEIHGDRGFGDDHAIVGGMARFHGQEVMVIGTQKGRDMKQRVYRNFGTPHPEGYRKALRIMKIAEKFGRPVFTLVDTDGAYPGLHAEERGQAEAIARNLREMSRLRVPILTTVIGVGGSGGALAIAVGDRVLMMENAIYSVISPEGCASIMWRDASKKVLAAEAMKITAGDLTELGVVDDVVSEPEGGAHTDADAAAALLDAALQKHFEQLQKLSIDELVAGRYKKFRDMAQFFRVEA
jgi:acetyl-CoA carboxylase carboxyl transferase subunit alpha